MEMIYLKNVTTLELDNKKCIGCGMCLIVCPHSVFVINNKCVSIVNKDLCMECGACTMNCPTQALSVKKGVGCAAAVINTALGRKSSSCCCSLDEGDGVREIGCNPQRSSCC